MSRRAYPMNKAFVREPEEEEGRCPACGSAGIPVGAETLGAQLPAAALAAFAESAFYCAYPGCPVGYFDRLRQTVPAALLRRPTYPKFPPAVLCACTGLTTADLEADFRGGNLVRIKDLIARAGSAGARCALEAPDGRPCAAEARKLWMRLRGGA